MQIANGAKFWVQGSDGIPFPEHKLEVKEEGLKTIYTTCELRVMSDINSS